jgi:ABC-type multidrug transport system ATPase subunit
MVSRSSKYFHTPLFSKTLLATLVGSAGISLSGGQKQRVALARALYSRKKLVILDDVFSGLDAETEEQVFTRLFGAKGLFRKMGTTVLLVTHAVHRLPYSNHIIALDRSGHVSEQGTFDELKNSGGYVQSLAAKHKEEDESNVKAEVTVQTSNKPLLVAEDEDTELEVAELNRRTGDFSVYKYYFAAMGWKQNTVFALCIILWGVGTKLTEFLLTFCKSNQQP